MSGLSSATAAQSSERAPTHRPGVGLLAGAGLHTGLALGARVGVGDLGVELTGGYQLLFAATDRDLGSDERSDVKFGSSAQFGAELYWTPWHPLESSAIGLKAGYRYSTVLEHGYALAVTFLVTLSRSVALEVLAGTQIYPGSNPRLRRNLGFAADQDLLFYNSGHQYFEYGFEFIWYPWGRSRYRTLFCASVMSAALSCTRPIDVPCSSNVFKSQTTIAKPCVASSAVARTSCGAPAKPLFSTPSTVPSSVRCWSFHSRLVPSDQSMRMRSFEPKTGSSRWSWSTVNRSTSGSGRALRSWTQE